MPDNLYAIHAAAMIGGMLTRISREQGSGNVTPAEIPGDATGFDSYKFERGCTAVKKLCL